MKLSKNKMMYIKGFAITALIILSLKLTIFGDKGIKAPNPDKEKLVLQAVMHVLENYHFQSVVIDDSFSIQVYDQFLKNMDDSKRFFIQEDIKEFNKYRLELDDQIKKIDMSFFELVIKRLDLRLSQVEKYYPRILETPFTFKKNELYHFNPDSIQFAKDTVELYDRWRKILKYDVMTQIHENLESYNSLPDTIKRKTFEELEVQARIDTKEDYDQWYMRIKKLTRYDRFDSYMNSITRLFDPHSEYFTPRQKEDFDISLSGKFEGIGARLQMDGNFTKVSSIVPGGPAYKQAELEVDDLIIKVRQQDSKDPIDVVGMRLDEVVSKIRGKKGTTVFLTVKKKNGNYKEIAIVRDIINTEETFARSMILDKKEDVNNIGYIQLPKFYSSFEGDAGTSCAADVAKEINKLKAENVNAIILDLRNNGGGSLSDVVKMSGLFIEQGPIVQVKSKNAEPYLLNDLDKNVEWTGPLVIMVNSFSASASEIIAAAMQDYDRAIIVGDYSTFGKGTVQRFKDLDGLVSGFDELKPLGEMKITVQKFYRVNGGSTQLRGVNSDIILPSRYDDIEIGEKDYEHAMKWSEVKKVPYQQQIFKMGNKTEITQKSQLRIAKNKDFKLTKEQANYYARTKGKKSVSLNYMDYKTMIDKDKMENKKFDSIAINENPNIITRNIKSDTAYINSDDKRVSRDVEWKKAIRKDIYINEVLNIIHDMINEQKKLTLNKK